MSSSHISKCTQVESNQCCGLEHLHNEVESCIDLWNICLIDDALKAPPEDVHTNNLKTKSP